METLREQLMRVGLGAIRIKYMGDKVVLLTAQDGIKLKEVV